MKYILILSLLLTGCYQSIGVDDIDAATDYCNKRRSSIQYINSYMLGGYKVLCLNTKTIMLYNKDFYMATK